MVSPLWGLADKHYGKLKDAKQWFWAGLSRENIQNTTAVPYLRRVYEGGPWERYLSHTKGVLFTFALECAKVKAQATWACRTLLFNIRLNCSAIKREDLLRRVTFVTTKVTKIILCQKQAEPENGSRFLEFCHSSIPTEWSYREPFRKKVQVSRWPVPSTDSYFVYPEVPSSLPVTLLRNS